MSIFCDLSFVSTSCYWLYKNGQPKRMSVHSELSEDVLFFYMQGMGYSELGETQFLMNTLCNNFRKTWLQGSHSSIRSTLVKRTCGPLLLSLNVYMCGTYRRVWSDLACKQVFRKLVYELMCCTGKGMVPLNFCLKKITIT